MRHTFALSGLPFLGAAECGLPAGVEVDGVALRPREILAAAGARIADLEFSPGVYSAGEIVDRVNRDSIRAYADVGPDGGVLVNELPPRMQAEARLARAKHARVARPMDQAAMLEVELAMAEWLVVNGREDAAQRLGAVVSAAG